MLQRLQLIPSHWFGVRYLLGPGKVGYITTSLYMGMGNIQGMTGSTYRHDPSTLWWGWIV